MSWAAPLAQGPAPWPRSDGKVARAAAQSRPLVARRIAAPPRPIQLQGTPGSHRRKARQARPEGGGPAPPTLSLLCPAGPHPLGTQRGIPAAGARSRGRASKQHSPQPPQLRLAPRDVPPTSPPPHALRPARALPGAPSSLPRQLEALEGSRAPLVGGSPFPLGSAESRPEAHVLRQPSEAPVSGAPAPRGGAWGCGTGISGCAQEEILTPPHTGLKFRIKTVRSREVGSRLSHAATSVHLFQLQIATVYKTLLVSGCPCLASGLKTCTDQIAGRARPGSPTPPSRISGGKVGAGSGL